MDPTMMPITPPRSDTATPEKERLTPSLPLQLQSLDQNTASLISISTAFYPDSRLQPTPPDVAFLSSDFVFFYVHRHVLLAASQNGFNALLSPTKNASLPSSPSPTPPSQEILAVPESSQVLNVVFHTVYSLSCAQYAPDARVLSDAVAALRIYAVPLTTFLGPGTPLNALLLSHASTAPLDVYVLAASHDLEDIAVAASQYLHALPLPDISDDLARRMGPLYLKRLFFLHLGRCDALKRFLTTPLSLHPPNADCGADQQGKVCRAWSLAAAYLVWESRPDMPCSVLESALTPLTDLLWCDLCRKATNDRIKHVLAQWAAVKKTI